MEDRSSSKLDYCFIPFIDIFSTVLYCVMFFLHHTQEADSSDIKVFTKLMIALMILWMGGLAIFDFTPSSKRPKNKKLIKALRQCHAIFLLTYFILLFSAGYHSFTGYLICTITVPLAFCSTEMWDSAVDSLQFQQIIPSGGNIEVEMGSPLVEKM
ncbi:unnamed protein product [Moneuplotes crassus]|uniref:Uncharacterized protein n=1 Tax=Euplotes crassus TaxID=5936 RepID=A0AAD1Y120_EUPCR|nr:unnamed protein product [Moneuplotes crassus]